MSPRESYSLESYLERISELQEQYGIVRTSDLAYQMGCKRPSVTNALQRLSEKGLINYKKYYPITLTDAGAACVNDLNRFHSILAEFLTKVLAFPDAFAQEEACSLEHRVSQDTIERMRDYLLFLKEKNLLSNTFEFEEFLKKNKRD